MTKDQKWIIIIYAVTLLAMIITTLLLPTVNPLWTMIIADIVGTIVVFLFSWRFDNTSVYDPYWSFAPVPLAFYWAYIGFVQGSTNNIRSIIVILLVLIWAIRLTWNWWMRWGGMEDEDWRYADYRPKTGNRYWLMSFAGFQMFPTVMVILGCLPLYIVLALGDTPLNILDLIAVAVTLLAIYLETQADNELRVHRTGDQSGKVLKTGLWSIMRHPNYLGEVLFWCGMFIFALAVGFTHWWTGVGALAMALLFRFVSIPLKEERMLKQRSNYREETKGIPAMFPKRLR